MGDRDVMIGSESERERFEDGRGGREPRNAGGLKKLTKPRKWAFF